MNEDYRAIMAELDAIDALCDQYLEQAEEAQAENWIAVDKTNMSCVFMNRSGEVRVIGAAYINSLFEGEQDENI